MILDRSEGGLRLSVPGDDPLSPNFHVLDLVTGMGREVTVAWRRESEMGVSTLRTYDLKGAQSGAGEMLREIWVAVLG